MIRIAFTKSNQPFSVEHEMKIKSFGLEWQVVNSNASRILIGAIIESIERAEALRRFLIAMGYEPVMIYYLNQEGEHIGDIPFAESEYINVMPDIVNYDEAGNEVSRNRPTVFKEVHNFSGWGAIVI